MSFITIINIILYSGILISGLIISKGTGKLNTLIMIGMSILVDTIHRFNVTNMSLITFILYMFLAITTIIIIIKELFILKSLKEDILPKCLSSIYVLWFIFNITAGIITKHKEFLSLFN